MKKFVLSLLLVFYWLPAIQAAEPSIEEIKALFQVINVESNYQAGLDGMIEVQKKSVPDFYLFETTFRDWVDQYLKWSSVEDDMVKLYQSYFTSEDIKQLVTFYQTPVGQKYIAKSPFIAKESMQIGADAANKNRHHLEEMIKVKIELLEKQGIYKSPQSRH